MSRTLQALGLMLAFVWVAGAEATSFSTNAGTAATGTLINNAGAPAPVYCNSSGCQATAPGGTYVTITAWSTPAPVGGIAGNSTSPTDTGNWLPAFLAIYGGNGIGISNTQEGTGATAAAPETYAQLTCSSGCPASNPEHVGNAPQHAIDNRGIDDILVVDFGTSGWDVTSFNLGYTCSINAAGTCGTTSVAVEAWMGGANGAAINFATESFNTNGIGAIPQIGGFTRLTGLTPDPVTGNVAISAPGTVTGRYLIITGALGAGTAGDLGTGVNGYSDAFKISSIVATGGLGPQGVPTPGSFALLALGLFALTFARRRLAAQA